MIRIRRWTPQDLLAAHAINEASVPAVSSITLETLERQVAEAHIMLVAEEEGAVLGFLLCYDEDAFYESRNYLWFVHRYGAFAYVDRIAVLTSATGRRIGTALYDRLERELGQSKPLLFCEINVRPPNPGSMRFHQRRGFTEIGRLTSEDGEKEVAMMARELYSAG